MSENGIAILISDLILTFSWMFCASAIPVVATLIEVAIGVKGDFTFVILTVIFTVINFVFNGLAELLGGASFNPAGNICNYAAGIPGDNLLVMALRFPVQAAGAVGGALAIKEVMPAKYQHMLGGPSLKVDVHTGAIAEGVLTFIISLAALIIVLRIPGGPLVKAWLLAMCTVALVVAGSSYTGPSMNPANAFGWAYINNKHNTWEQFYVYWIFPFIGAMLAATVFKIIFPPTPPKKQKKSRKEE